MIDRESEKEIENYRLEQQRKVEELFYNQNRVAKIVDIARILGAQDFVDIDRKKGVVSFRAKEYVDFLVEKYKETQIQIQLPKAVEVESEIVFPAGEGEIKIGSGRGVEEKREFPRNALFIELLSEHNIPYENPRISHTTDEMMRGEGYTVYFLPTLQKTVCVNNEEGNTTIILFGTQSYDDARKIFSHYTKDQIRTECNDVAECIDWEKVYDQNQNLWKEKIHEVLRVSEPVQRPVRTEDKDNTVDNTVTKGTTNEKRTLHSTILELQRAHTEWKLLPEDRRGKFNAEWLKNNGYSGLYRWTKKNGGISALVKTAGEDVERDFNIQKMSAPYTRTSAIKRLFEAHYEWSNSPEDTRGRFNAEWLKNNGMEGLYNWIHRNSSIGVLIKEAGMDVKYSDPNNPHREAYTEASATKKLLEAYHEWSNSPEDTRGRFNVSWFTKNGYGGLYNWAWRNGGIDALVEKTNGTIQSDFEKPKKAHTQESSLKTLQMAHTAWKQLPENRRGKFNAEWLRNNGYNGLYEWAKKNGGIPALVKIASEEIQKDFEKRK